MMKNVQPFSSHAHSDARSCEAMDLHGIGACPIFSTPIAAEAMEAVWDAIPDVVFFVKDTGGRYIHVNLTLVRRVGMKRREEVIGRTVHELYSTPLGDSYARQDQRVLRGETIENQLELQVFPNRTLGWCVTHKRPLHMHGRICGIVGISRDLGQPDKKQPIYMRLRRILDYLQTHYAENLRVQFLAALGDLSVAQLERHFRRVFQITPQQMLTKLRIEASMTLLGSTDSIATIGQSCGFADQSAFARQFKATVGITPTDYRRVANGAISDADDANDEAAFPARVAAFS
jgi:PAS domain S-box-containing protein